MAREKTEKIIGVRFNSTSKKYRGKNYYYRTDKDVKTNQKIIVETRFNDKTKAVVSRSNYKGKVTNKHLKRY